MGRRSPPTCPADATRNLSGNCLNALADVLPGLVGGSADLASSNMTLLKKYGNFQKDTPRAQHPVRGALSTPWEPSGTGSPSISRG